MKTGLIIGAAAAALAGGANAAELRIEDTVARVQIVPEARGDILVEVRPGSGLPAPVVRRSGDRITVSGDLETRGCNRDEDGMTVRLRGRDSVDMAEAPLVLVRAPRSFTVST